MRYGEALRVLRVHPAVRRQRHPVARPGERDVEQSALVGVGALVAGDVEARRRDAATPGRCRSARREPPVGQRRQEHDRPLQALGAVDGAERDAVGEQILLAVEVVVAAVRVVDEQEREVLVEPLAADVAADLFARVLVVAPRAPRDRLVVGEHVGESRDRAEPVARCSSVVSHSPTPSRARSVVEVADEADVEVGLERAWLPGLQVLPERVGLRVGEVEDVGVVGRAGRRGSIAARWMKRPGAQSMSASQAYVAPKTAASGCSNRPVRPPGWTGIS